jgi:hypothetical protein
VGDTGGVGDTAGDGVAIGVGVGVCVGVGVAVGVGGAIGLGVADGTAEGVGAASNATTFTAVQIGVIGRPVTESVVAGTQARYEPALAYACVPVATFETASTDAARTSVPVVPSP